MPLYVCVRLPDLALEAFSRALADNVTRPFAVASGGSHPAIVSANDAAAAAGVRARQSASAAIALAPDLVLRDRDVKTEADALANVAAWITQFTPAVHLAPSDAVLAEIGASLRLFGGLPNLRAQLEAGIAQLGYRGQLAFAPTAGAALLFSRCGRIEPLLDRRALDAALAPLPLAKLDADADAVTLLASAGVTTIGQACALPRDALARRVGPAFVDTLDRMRGCAADPREPFAPPPRYEGRLELPSSVENVEALAFALNRLVHELAGWLLGRGLGVTRLSLGLVHERYAIGRDTPARTDVPFALAAPAREPAHLNGVLRERLARVALRAPVVALALASEQAAPLPGRNLGLLADDAAAATAVPLIDRLRARLGEHAVVRVDPKAEHRPERASAEKVGSESTIARPRKVGSESTFRSPTRHRMAERKVDSDPTFRAPRPAWLLAEPAPLAEVLEREPWILRDGPERIESGWWDDADVRRDYYVAESPRGELCWIYRDHRYGIDDGEWFLHGLFA
jgi:protein ImuB